ncbi:MAG: site-2 protease family protein [Steroidobacteraceae bacterium]|nr:site-2 protease family protein [Steroidobacteraceae bacterium]
MNFTVFLTKISIWAIPVLFAITLHEVAHGWAARYFGDRTAELLGRLSLNPLRHIDPVGTVLVPGLLLAFGGPLFGWAKPVPVALRSLRDPRRSMIWVALAGPAANLAMAALWCAVLGLVARLNGSLTVVGWVALMAQAGILINVVLALFNLLPIPPLDGGRVLAGLLPPRFSLRLERIEPIGFLIVLGLTAFGLFGWLFDPAYRLVGQVIGLLIGNSA